MTLVQADEKFQIDNVNLDSTRLTVTLRMINDIYRQERRFGNLGRFYVNNES
jgi:hypothetical protein